MAESNPPPIPLGEDEAPTAPTEPTPNVFNDQSNFEVHETEGARSTMHGYQLQFKSIMLWIMRAINAGKQFRVSTEDKKYGKFDDFFICESDGANEYQRFVQVKGTRDSAALGFQGLFGSKINMKEFMKSFMKVHQSGKFIEDSKFIMYTNKGLLLESLFNKKESLDGCLNWSEKCFDALLDCEMVQFKPKNILLEALIKDTEYTTEDAKLFLKYFWIASSPETNEKKLAEKIKQESTKNIFDEYQGEMAYNYYYTNFLEWYTQRKGTILDRTAILKYFTDMRDKFSKKENFNLVDPIENFFGREKEIDQMTKVINNNNSKKTIDIVITGTAGIGKSELVREFCKLQKPNFQHIFWICAETKECYNSSLKHLARYFKLEKEKIDKDSSKVDMKEDTRDLEHLIYDYVKERKCIFIFDNVESNLREYSQLLKKICSNKNLKVILTSQVQYSCCALQIELEVFSEEESIDFIKKNIDDHLFNAEAAKDIAIYLSCLPLALQLALSYIKKKEETLKLVAKTYNLHNFIQNFKQGSDSFLKHEFDRMTLDNYQQSLTIAWKLAIDSLRQEPNGEEALDMLLIMAYLEPDNIHISLFEPKFSNAELLADCIYLLKTYSLVKCDIQICSIHRLIQTIIRRELSRNESEKSCIILQQTEEPVVKQVIELVCIAHCDRTVHSLCLWAYIENNKNWVMLFFEHNIKSKKFLANLPFVTPHQNQLIVYCILKRYIQFIRIRNFDNFIDKYTISLIVHCLRILKDHEEFQEGTDFLDYVLEGFNAKKLIMNYKWKALIDLNDSVSFFYYTVDLNEKSVVMWDVSIQSANKLQSRSRVENLEILVGHLQYRKALALSWQHRYREAAAVLIESFAVIVKCPDFLRVVQFDKYGVRITVLASDFPFLDKENNLITPLFYSIYIIYLGEGSEKALSFLESLLLLCSESPYKKIPIFQCIGKIHRLKNNLRKEMIAYEKVIELFIEITQSALPKDKVSLSLCSQEIWTYLQNFNVTFTKTVSLRFIKLLKSLCLHMESSMNSVLAQQCKLLICKFLSSLPLEVSMKEKTDFQALCKEVDTISESPAEVICDMARRYYIEGHKHTAEAILKETSSQPDLKIQKNKTDIKFTINMCRVDFMLFDQNISSAVEELKHLLTEYTRSEYYLKIYMKMCEIFYKTGDYKEILSILNNVLKTGDKSSYRDLSKKYALLAWESTACTRSMSPDQVQFYHDYFTETYSHRSEKEYLTQSEMERKIISSGITNKIKLSQVLDNTSPLCFLPNYVRRRIQTAYFKFKINQFTEALSEIKNIRDELVCQIRIGEADLRRDLNCLHKLVVYCMEQNNEPQLDEVISKFKKLSIY